MTSIVDVAVVQLDEVANNIFREMLIADVVEVALTVVLNWYKTPRRGLDVAVVTSTSVPIECLAKIVILAVLEAASTEVVMFR